MYNDKKARINSLANWIAEVDEIIRLAVDRCNFLENKCRYHNESREPPTEEEIILNRESLQDARQSVRELKELQRRLYHQLHEELEGMSTEDQKEAVERIENAKSRIRRSKDYYNYYYHY